jgi:Mg2+-importing ATPase
VAVDYLGYYAASVVAVAAALAITGMEGHADPTVVALGALFIAFGIVFSAMILWLSGRRRAPQNALARIKLVRRAIALLANADRKLVRRARGVCESTCFQLAVLVLDAATVWVCIRALGANASVVGVFASYMLATTARAIGIVPGGLGIFEGASVVTLELAGVPAVAALSGTLLYRVLSYWLPMAPGAWFFHRAAKRESPAPLPTNEEAVRGAEATPASNRTRSSASGSA